MWGHVTQGRVSHVGEVLLSLTSVKGVIVCINPHWWDWSDDVPPTRVRGRIIKWVSKRAGIEQLSIEWELGSGDDGYIAGQVTYTEPEVSDLSKPSASMGKFLTNAQYAFTLEPYVNGTPAPSSNRIKKGEVQGKDKCHTKSMMSKETNESLFLLCVFICNYFCGLFSSE
jgi:hypothetical protein